MLAGRHRAAIGRRFRESLRTRGAATLRSPESQWFWDHYRQAATEVVSFCTAAGLSLQGSDIADVGCGDGIMAVGICHRALPRALVGFDIVPTNIDNLLARIRSERVGESIPEELEFRQSDLIAIPAHDAEFDFVYSWSAFEHIADPVAMLGEIRRVLRPGGHFFLQVWPFYHSAKGSHLWEWFDEDFHHLLANDRETVAQIRASDRHSAEWTAYMTSEFEGLNRITVDELQRAVLTAGFEVRQLELLTAPVHLVPELARYSWCDLAVGGVKFLAIPAR